MPKSFATKRIATQVERWMKQAEHNLEVARKNFDIKVYDLAIVMCEQALEKALKALYIAQTGKMPPRTHAIEDLAELTHFETRLDKMLLELEDFYIQLRYPSAEGPMPYELATREDAERDTRMTADALELIQDEINHVQQKH